MKRRLLLFLTMCIGMVSGAWAELETTTIDGKEYYKIGTPQDLVDFAALVNSGGDNMSVNAVLINDIDMEGVSWPDPIGNWVNSIGYKGHFDGQGHKIENLEYTTAMAYHGFFGVLLGGAVVENFSIYGDVTNESYDAIAPIAYSKEASVYIRNIHSYMNITSSGSDKKIGGILGNGNKGTTYVDRCVFSGTLSSTNKTNCGGIVAYIQNNVSSFVHISNCLFDGKITSTANDAYCGGMVGYIGTDNSVYTIKNCLSIGTLDAPVAGSIFGYVRNGGAGSSNLYYYGSKISGKTQNTGANHKATSVTEEDLASGMVCYQLNGNQEDIAFYQTLPTDKVPTLDDTHDHVYMNGRQHCNGEAYDGVSYSNENLGMVTDEHIPVDGFCSYCGALDETYMTANDEGIYEIGTPAQLKWFAAHVNKVNPAVDAVLTADIDLDGVTWTPIGFGVNYTGTFDGQGFSISNFYLSTTANSSGLFGQVSGGAVIKNFTIEGEIVSNGHQYVGGVVGNVPSGIVTISGVHSKVDISCSVSRHGGILGAQTNPSTINIDRCIYSGTFDAQSTSGNYGGFIGLTNNNSTAYVNITNSLFDGKIINVGDNAGGFIGYTRGCKLTIQNCLSKGTIEATNPGQFIGQLNATSNQEYVGVNCYVEGKTQGTGSATEAGPTPIQVTAEQLASGYVAAKLAPAFRQVIGTDATPVLDATKPVVAQITAAGYATLYVPETSLEIPEGVTAYTGTIDGEWLKLNPLENIITNGQAVVLKGAAGFYGFAPTDAGFGLVKSDLVAEEEDITADGTQYVLAKVDDKVGFYQAKADTKIAARKAYLKVPAETEVKGFIFAEEDATAIANVNVNVNDNQAPVYNLAGQRVNKATKGIYVVGGKKVLK